MDKATPSKGDGPKLSKGDERKLLVYEITWEVLRRLTAVVGFAAVILSGAAYFAIRSLVESRINEVASSYQEVVKEKTTSAIADVERRIRDAEQKVSEAEQKLTGLLDDYRSVASNARAGVESVGSQVSRLDSEYQRLLERATSTATSLNVVGDDISGLRARLDSEMASGAANWSLQGERLRELEARVQGLGQLMTSSVEPDAARAIIAETQAIYLSPVLTADKRVEAIRKVEALGSMARSAGRDLSKLLADTGAPLLVRARAAQAVGQIGYMDNTTLALLGELSRGESPMLRQAAALALGYLKRSGAVDIDLDGAGPILYHLLGDRDLEVRKACMMAMGEFESESVKFTEILLMVIRDVKLDTDARTRAVRLLGNTGAVRGAVVDELLQIRDSATDRQLRKVIDGVLDDQHRNGS